jgi:nitric oxide reductase NorD protein
MSAGAAAAQNPAAAADPDQRPLQMFASALAGRPLALAQNPPTGAARASGGPGWLWLPPPDDGSSAERRARRLVVLRQVVGQQPDGRWAIDDEALAAAGLWGPLSTPESRQAVDAVVDPETALARCLASWPRSVLLRRLFHTLEASREDASLVRQFPGVRGDLARTPARPSGFRHAALAAWASACNPSDQPMAGAIDSMKAAVQQLTLLLAGREPGRQPLQAVPTLRVLPDAEPATSASAIAEAGLAAPVVDAAPQSPGAASGQLAGGGLPSPLPRRASAQPAQPDASGPESPAAAAVSTQAAVSRAGLHTQWHDEWDYKAGGYRRAWTCVQVRSVQGRQADFLARLRTRHAPLLRAIRRHFSATPPTARARGGTAADGDQIDLDQALASLIDRRAGGQGEARPYRHRPRLQRDVCTAVLLDTSGSTGFAVPLPHDPQDPHDPQAVAADDDDDGLLYGFRPRGLSPGPAPRRVIDIAHDAIALMCEGLHLLGDRHAIFGFSGQGRLQVDLRVAKGFDQPWSAQTAAALAALEPEGSTRTGAAIRYAVSQLLLQPAHTRVLMLVTDGYPQDQDHRPDRNDRAYGLHDTAQALREAARAGVAAFCITVDQAAHDCLRGVCPTHRYLVIDDVNSLPERLSRLYRRLTSA